MCGKIKRKVKSAVVLAVASVVLVVDVFSAAVDVAVVADKVCSWMTMLLQTFLALLLRGKSALVLFRFVSLLSRSWSAWATPPATSLSSTSALSLPGRLSSPSTFGPSSH